MKLIVHLFVCLFALIVNGIDVKTLKEQKCLKTAPKAGELNFEWAIKVGNWYFPLGSELDMYLSAAELRNTKIEDFRPHDLYYKACIRFVWGQEVYMTGFGNKRVDIPMTPNADGSFNFRCDNINTGGVSTPVLSDNKSFILFYTCWDDNHASWGVITTVPVLPAKVKKQIHNHVKKLGFYEKHFTEVRYESCDATTKETEDGKDEL